MALLRGDLGAPGAHVRTVARPARAQLRQREAVAVDRRAHRVRHRGRQRQQLQALVADPRRRADQPARAVVQVRFASDRVRRIARRRSVQSAASEAIQSARGGGGQFGGSGRRGGAHVGAEVGDGEVGLVADAGDDRHAAADDRARHHFFVEAPQVFDRAAAAAHQQHVDFGAPRGAVDGLGDLVGRALALHRARVQHDADVRRAPLERAEDVAQRRRLRAGDDADAAREQRQWALALRRRTGPGRRAFPSAAGTPRTARRRRRGGSTRR